MTNHRYEICESDEHPVPDLLWIGGSPGMNLIHREQFDLRKDGTLVWRAAILWESSCSPFKSQLVWEEAKTVLFGAHDQVYGLDIFTGAIKFQHKLESYFSSFVLDLPHGRVFIFTGTEVLYFGENLRERWSTRGLAVDGVVCRKLEDEFLIVDAEMDPPGGWQTVTIDLKTGKELSRCSTPKT